MQTLYFFPTPTFHFQFPEVDNSSIVQSCLSMRDHDSGNVISNVGGWQSKSMQEYPAMNNLLENVTRSIIKCSEELRCFKPMKIMNFWININSNGDYNKVHNHPGSFFSGCYYVKTTEDSAELVVKRNCFENYFYSSHTDGKTPATYPEFTYKPVAGNIIIFPSWLEHSVNVNSTKEERISIAFNFGF